MCIRFHDVAERRLPILHKIALQRRYYSPQDSVRLPATRQRNQPQPSPCLHITNITNMHRQRNQPQPSPCLHIKYITNMHLTNSVQSKLHITYMHRMQPLPVRAYASQTYTSPTQPSPCLRITNMNLTNSLPTHHKDARHQPRSYTSHTCTSPTQHIPCLHITNMHITNSVPTHHEHAPHQLGGYTSQTCTSPAGLPNLIACTCHTDAHKFGT